MADVDAETADVPMEEPTLLEQMTQMLAANLTRVIDLFRDWDDDEDGQVSKLEFRRALPLLGFKVERSVAEDLFDSFDEDKSGSISYDEMQSILARRVELDANLKAGAVEFTTESKNKIALRKGPAEGISGALGSQTKLLTGEGAPPVIDQIRDALSKNLARVIDLFREWDDDGSGSVSKVEFRRALSILGLQIPKADANALFDTLDDDHSGSIDFAELSKKLKPKVTMLPKVRSAPRLTAPPSFTGAAQYKEALAAEQAAKRRLARIQKQLVRAASMSSLQEQKEKNRLEGLAVRKTLDKLVGRDVTERFSGTPAASDADVTALAVMFHEKMAKTFLQPSWIKLFTWMDDDRSGRITYDELEKMVRSHLNLHKTRLPEERLQSLWVALDEDTSGFISAGEFGRFMKKGEKAAGPTFRQRVAERNQKLRAEQDADYDKLSGQDTTKRLDKVERASEEDVVALAELLTTQMAKIFPGTDRSWIKLFKAIDEDQSGRISFQEMKAMVRKTLQLTEATLSEARLESIWKAIDADDSGWISFGEFGGFMRKASALKAQQATSRATEDETARRKRVALEERAARMLAAKIEEDERLVAAARESAALAQQLAEDAARLEKALKKGMLKGQHLRGQPHHVRIQPGSGDDQAAASAAPAAPPLPRLLRPKRVGIGVDF